MQVIKPGIYKHYKGNQYEVIGIANHSETLEKFVVYRALYNSKEFGDKALWVRPVNNFCELLEINGKNVNRFQLIK